jgi:CubicO group peptidase (beta-lactamase class C family)
MQLHLLHALWCLLFVYQTLGACSPPSLAFPLPDYSRHQPFLLDALQKIQNEVESIVADKTYDTTAFSIEVTSSNQTLWSSFHTARDRDALRPGAVEVNGNSAYRIASITKTFTTLGVLQQHAAGNLNLDDSVDTYLTELKGPQSGSIPWKDITLRSLASQLSGLPQDCERGLT